jgi:two-component system sensor histidine kinase HydH
MLMLKNIIGSTKYLKPRNFFFLFLILTVLMFSSALIELRESKQELFQLMSDQAHILLETIITYSRNNILTNFVIEDVIEERLLNNAVTVKMYYEKGLLDNQFLEEFARNNQLFRINIFSTNGKKRFSSYVGIHQELENDTAPVDLLEPIFSGVVDTLILGLKAASHEEGFRFAVALAAEDRSAIVINLDAEKILQFRKEIGFGSLFRKIISNPGIHYAALQDTSGILAASGNIEELEKINSSPFLKSALYDSTLHVREVEFDAEEVFEAVHAFYFEGESVGLFRIGLSLAPLQVIKARIYRRITFISLILLVIGFILLALFLIRQNLDITQKQYQTVETYSRNIIENVSDAIIVFSKTGQIRIFNHSAEKLFHLKAPKVVGRLLLEIFPQELAKDILRNAFSMQEINYVMGDINRDLLISKSRYLDEEEEWINILVIRDLTDQKRLESQIQRRERLSALGELASGVAHEIRNPLNAIGTVIQQLDRDFEPKSLNTEYHQLTQLVYREVKRMNHTIEDFLKFARPSALNPEEFSLNEFVQDIRDQYTPLMQEKLVDFQIEVKWNGTVRWDRSKMKQVFVNLLQNALEVLNQNGQVLLSILSMEKEVLEITFADNGPGISEEDQRKIFNLYFTTKTGGTGIGLSIVQRIIDQHNGNISLESQIGKGTKFIIRIPIVI